MFRVANTYIFFLGFGPRDGAEHIFTGLKISQLTSGFYWFHCFLESDPLPLKGLFTFVFLFAFRTRTNEYIKVY